ncbi:MAG: BrnA antitoxin family protein [Paracoccaceae bacterium]|nr:MAG: BrnA antitoxin family protein [Paracoccaceae bacterium]
MPKPSPAPARHKPAAHYHYLAETLRDLEGALRHGLKGSAFVPAEWAAVAQGVPEPLKEKLTLRVDADVLRFFRLMGRGYLTQMNRVLRAFMHARLAGVVPGAEDVGYAPDPLETYITEAAALVEAMSARNSRLRTGADVTADDVEIDRRMARVRRMEVELNLPEAVRVTG